MSIVVADLVASSWPGSILGCNVYVSWLELRSSFFTYAPLLKPEDTLFVTSMLLGLSVTMI